MSEKKPAVPALWFDKDGCGPDCLAIRPQRMVEGGFVMDRESVKQLAASLDDWLEVTAPPDAGPRQKTAIDIIGRLWPAIEAANGTIHLIASWYMGLSARENSIAALAQKAQEVCEGSGWVVSSVYGHEFNIQCPKDGT